MKFERIYLGSGTNKKRDKDDYINYYRAENGMVIMIEEPLNTPWRWYDVYDNEEHAKASGHFNHEGCLRSYDTLREAKDFIERRCV